MLIVWLTESLSFLAASCWSVDVVKGAAGVLVPSFFSMLLIVNLAPICLSRYSRADSMSGKRLSSVAFTRVFSGVPSGWKIASIL